MSSVHVKFPDHTKSMCTPSKAGNSDTRQVVTLTVSSLFGCKGSQQQADLRKGSGELVHDVLLLLSCQQTTSKAGNGDARQVVTLTIPSVFVCKGRQQQADLRKGSGELVHDLLLLLSCQQTTSGVDNADKLFQRVLYVRVGSVEIQSVSCKEVLLFSCG